MTNRTSNSGKKISSWGGKTRQPLLVEAVARQEVYEGTQRMDYCGVSIPGRTDFLVSLHGKVEH